MTEPAILGRSRATLIYRPVRRMYSIPANDPDLLREVVRHASARWGGVLDLIAVEDSPGVWNSFDLHCAQAGDPDRVIVVGRDPKDEHSRFEALATATDLEVVTFRSHMYPADAGTPLRPGPLEPVYADPGGSLFAAMSWGEPSPSLLDLDYDNALNAVVPMNPVGEKWAMPPERILWQSLFGTTVLQESARGLVLRTGDIVFEHPYAFVGIANPTDFDALTFFWNVRALLLPYRTRVVALPMWIDLGAFEEVRIQLQRTFGGTTNVEPDAVVHVVRGEDAAAAERLMTEGLGLARFEGPRLSRFFPARNRAGPPCAALVNPSLPAHVLIQAAASAEYPVIVGSEIRLHVARPETVPYQSVVEAIDVPELMVPRRATVASLVAPGTRATAAGLAWTGVSNGEFRANVVSDRDVVSALLRHHGITTATSNWGIAADRTLALLGGLSSLDPLASDGALQVIDLLSERGSFQRAGSGRTRPERLEALPLGTIASQLGQHTAFGTKAAAGPILDGLVRAGVVFAGFRVECERCSAEYWRVVDEVRTEMVCEGCRAIVHLTMPSRRHSTLEPIWEYRLNEVLAWPLDQGVIPGLLALRRMTRDAAVRARLLLGQNLTAADFAGEIDIVGALDREPVVAEVKAGATLTAEEIDSILMTAERVRGGAYFATTAPSWDAATTALLVQAVAARPRVRVRQFLRSDLLS